MIGRVLDHYEFQTTEGYAHLPRDWEGKSAAVTSEVGETFNIECPVWKRQTERPFRIPAFLPRLRVQSPAMHDGG